VKPRYLLAAALLAAPAATTTAQPTMPMRIDKNLVYSSPGGRDLLLDIYRPAAAASSPLPVVMWVYGGAFRAGSKDDNQTAGATWLTQHGYAVVAFNYRLSQVAKYPAQIDDCKAAVRWVREHAPQYGLDPARIAAWGASAGGNLAAMLGTTSGGNAAATTPQDRVQAVVDFFGPTDFLRMDEQAIPGGQKHNPAESPESQLIGGPIQDNPEKAARANPAAYAAAGNPPFLILHGDRDPLVPVGQSEILFAALRRANVDVIFHKIVGAGHGGPPFQSPVVRAMVLAFLDQHLKRTAR
jgi:acetyl esterase/lipase